MCSFMFRPGVYDEDFHRLDAEIDAFARALPGFLSTRTWYSEDRTTVNAVYLFDDISDVRALAAFESHRQAKRQVGRWYDSYQVVVSTVTATYGDPDWPLD